ncbi:putative serine family amino acid catabolism- protein [Diplodia seriata]|uniref:L-serine ammonia-lyase n=1 Tax=Diplodia seriata TaxID=420778 RepID=A0A0G2EDA1_9PEZI|nr:putative serine family amino acid catabolism- protein [Diplodia seriata]
MTLALLRAPHGPSTVHFFCSSGGNAGLAAVHASHALHRPCTVVVPLSTKPFMIGRLRAAGAHDVVQVGATWAEADAHLRDVELRRAEERGETGVYVPPFDHED